MERPYGDMLNSDSSSYVEFTNRYGASSMASSSTTSSPPTITLDEGQSAPSGGRAGGVKYCGVCGDIAKSYHFGGLSCDSCKAFFRRSVQNDNYLHFQCCHRGQCTISLSNRKSCQYCRMKRCFGIGMEKSWVMTEDERKALMKARAEKKHSKRLNQSASPGRDDSQTSSNYEPQMDRMTDFMSQLEIKELESVVTKYMHAYQHVPYRQELRHFDNHRPGVQVMEMFGTLIRRFAFYARLMPDFAGLPFPDQSILLKGGVLEMCLLRGALVFDPLNNRWPNVNMSLYKDSPTLRLNDIGHLTSTRLFQMHMDFISYMQSMSVDEPTIMLLILIVLYTPERAGLMHPDWIEKYQSYYTGVLEHYMNWRYGRAKAKSMFGKLLTRLSDLRELSDTHNHHNLRLDNEEITSIQSQLNSLKLNPYPELKVVPDGNDASPVVTGWPTRDSPASNENAAIYAKDISGCLSDVELKSPAPSAYCQQQADVTANLTHENTCAMGGVIQQQQQQQQQQSGQMSMHHLQMLQQHQHQAQFNVSGAMMQQQQQQFAPQQMSQQQMNMMAMQFVQAMQRSVSQVANQPHFGFEWVKPDYQFDPEVTFGNMDADPSLSSDSATSANSSDASSSYYYASSQPAELHPIKGPANPMKYDKEALCQIRTGQQTFDDYSGAMN